MAARAGGAFRRERELRKWRFTSLYLDASLTTVAGHLEAVHVALSRRTRANTLYHAGDRQPSTVHSFTAPPSRPRTSARCDTRNTTATGTTASRVASASSGRKMFTC